MHPLLWLPLLAAAAFVLAEFAARLWLHVRAEYFVLARFSKKRLLINLEALPSLQPEVSFEVNADGERGNAPPEDVEGTFRVLVAGGSAAECFYLDQGSTWPAVVGQALEAAGVDRLGTREVHVGSVAISLVPCETICYMLERILPRYRRLDVVVLMVGASDVVGWLEKKTPAEIPSGRVSAQGLMAEHPEGPFGWKPETLALRRIAARLQRRFLPRVMVKTGVGKTIARNRAMRAEAREILDEVPDPTPMLEYFEQHLRRLIRIVQQCGARVLVVRQPWFDKEFTPEEAALLWNFGQGRPYAGEIHTYYTHGVVSRLMQRVDEVSERVAQQEGAAELHLMPILERSFETYYDYLHFSPQGARVVGREVARKILSMIEAEKSAAPISSEAPLTPPNEARSADSSSAP